MSTGPTCDQVAGDLAELALGVLGADRAGAVRAHLAGCGTCRAEAAHAGEVVARLAAAAPGPPPPAALADRALARMGLAATPTPTRARRRPRVGALVVAVVALALLVGGVVGWGLGRDEPAPAAARTGQLVRADGRAAGTVVVEGDPAWMAVHLPGAYPGAAYGCRLVLDDGAVVEVGRWSAGAGVGGWVGDLPVDPARVRAVELTTPDGATWATAAL